MTKPAAITVYLDTQDYSRFGDVIRNKTSSAEFTPVFERLKELKARGRAKFVYSMPVVSELLQYDSEYEETCVAKAKAIEELCGDNALIFPGRLVEAQANAFGYAKGIIADSKTANCIRSGNEWFPRVAGSLDSLQSQMRVGVDATIQNMGPLPRAARRRLKTQGQERTIINAARAAIPGFASTYQLPCSAVERSIVELLRGRISSDQASLRLFSAICRPTAFIHVYFKAYKGDQTAIPSWMRNAGETLQSSFLKFRDKAAPLLTDKNRVSYLREIIAKDVARLGLTLLRIIDTDEAEFGINEAVRDAIAEHPDASNEIPCCQLISTLLLGYIEQTVAVLGGGAKIEHSFGGDLIHALYIDCVDLWRGDRRFSELIKQKSPVRRSKLQASLVDLPARIEQLWTERGTVEN